MSLRLNSTNAALANASAALPSILLYRAITQRIPYPLPSFPPFTHPQRSMTTTTTTTKASSSSSESLSRADLFQAAGGAFLGAAALLTVAPQRSNAETTLASRKVLYFRVSRVII